MGSRKRSINRVFLFYMAIVGFASIVPLGFLWISSELSQFEADAERRRASYLEDQKTTLKREVDRALAFVHYMQSKTEERLKSSAKNRVYEAHAIAANIFNAENDKSSLEEIRTTIRETLRPVRFNNGRGYYFAFTLSGVETLFPIRPELEGASMLKVQGGKGEHVVTDMLKIVSQHGEGFYRYTWPKPNHNGFYPKIAYVKLLEPVGWVIGTGEYLDDVKIDIQQECLEWISNIKFGKDGYVFAGQWDGVSLSGPAIGKNMYAIEDINGVKIVQELIKTAQQGGGYVHYVLPRFEGTKHAPKVSYAVGVPEWRWYIGSGVYVDEIEMELAQRKSAHYQDIKTKFRNVILLLLSVFIIILLLVKFLSNRLRENVNVFINFFNKASKEAIQIDTAALHFSEFEKLAESGNEMSRSRKRAEISLRKNEERLRTIIENAPDAFFVHNLEGQILQVNEAACRNLRYARDELIGMSVADIEKSVTIDEAVEIWQTITDRAGLSFEGMHQRKDGTHFPVEVMIALVHDKEEALLVGFARDISERKQMEKERERYQGQIIQAQKLEAIGTLAGGIAHDFNNLLMSIQGRASLMTFDLEASHPCFEHVTEIMEASRSAASLTQQLLGVARGGKYEARPIDINQVVHNSANMFGRTKKEIRIHTKLHKPPPVASADRNQIEQVLLNIYINAWQAMPYGGELYLETAIVDLDDSFCKPHAAKTGRYAKISVTDTGVGMDKSTQARIFDPFYTTKDKVRGTGLGLASTYGIVKNHEGIVTVDSTVGQGATFNIYLPVSEEEVPREDGEEGSIARGAGTILLVDDEMLVINVGKAMLEKLGYHVIVAINGQTAIEVIVLQGIKIDMVILDMIMPGMGGLETLDKIREINPELPVILSSGYTLDGQGTDIMDKGCNGFIQKPFGISELSEKIQRLLG